MPDDSVTTQTNNKESKKTLKFLLACLGCGGLSIVLLAILAAFLAVPSFLNRPTRTRVHEAITYLGAMNRGQQAYFIENQAFSPSIEDLDLGLRTATDNYSYSIELQPDGAVMTATPLKEQLKYYTGAVFTVGETPDSTTTQICESAEAIMPAIPSLNPLTKTIDCPQGSLSL